MISASLFMDTLESELLLAVVSLSAIRCRLVGWAFIDVVGPHLNSPILQDNVFVQMLCSIQYRVVRAHADDAFYELQNPREQIQAYVFDGEHKNWLLWSSCLLLLGWIHVLIHNVNSSPPPTKKEKREKRKEFVFLLLFSLDGTSSYYWLFPVCAERLWFVSCPCSCPKDELGWAVWTKRWGC